MKILVSDKVSGQGVEILQQAHEVDVRYNLSPDELIAVIPQYDALVVRSETKVTSAVIEAATNLKVIGRAGVGVDNIDIQAATEKGIMVINAPDGNTIAAAEHTMAMMLALARNVPQAYHSMKEGKWERSKFMGVEMRGKILGVIGLGRIGTGVAKRALAFEMIVWAYDPFISEERAQDLGIELAELNQIYAQADFITLHMPLTVETKHLLNEDAFAKMKKGIRIVQCARGGLIDEGALIKAVEAGIVAGAALDVFEKEPIVADNPLLTLENVIVTPHLGASTKEAQVGVAVDVAEGVLAALNGEPVTTA
ncbi:MAG TPA: phosphoglycerate dehydrogenase, partial [Desulfosporosinus sp.]|nr:phosphoglycerate dehydrogenase [Desulfosporosinus sp.]